MRGLHKSTLLLKVSEFFIKPFLFSALLDTDTLKTQKNGIRAEKNSFFRFYFPSCTSSRRGKAFLIYKNFISLTVQEIMGGQDSVTNKRQTEEHHGRS